MSRQADLRSLFVSRKSGEQVRHTAFCDLVNPYNRYSLLMSDRPIFIEWLQETGLLCESMHCLRCSNPCKMTAPSNTIDGYSWRCRNRHETSIRHKSVFSGSHMHLEDVFNFVLSYAEGHSLKHSAFVSSMDYGSSAVEWAKIVRRMYVHYYFDVVERYVMRGCVEIDESLFGRRVKHHRGEPRGTRVWIVGIVERETNFLKLFPVDKRDAATLIPLIQQHVAAGSIVLTDGWRAYRQLSMCVTSTL
jgi:hypothetical protein